MRDVKGMGGRWSGVRGLRMEEEIISNRWKELDYDGYYLVIATFPSHLISSGSIGPRVRDGGKGAQTRWNRMRWEGRGNGK